MLGFLCLVVGAAVAVGKFLKNFDQNVGSLAFGDLITLSSTSSLTMVFNCVLSVKMLNEVFSRYDLISIVLIGIGASLCVIFSNYSTDKTTIEVS